MSDLPPNTSPTDVLMHYNHFKSNPGNIRLETIVEKYRNNYVTMDRHDKGQTVSKIVDQMKETGARFISFDKSNDRWVELDPASRRDKIHYLLRKKSTRTNHLMKKQQHLQLEHHQKTRKLGDAAHKTVALSNLPQYQNDFEDTRTVFRPQDVLFCAQPATFYSYPGNARLRELVDTHRDHYLRQTTKDRRATIIKEIINTLASEGRRFLEYDHRSQSWRALKAGRPRVFQNVQNAILPKGRHQTGIEEDTVAERPGVRLNRSLAQYEDEESDLRFSIASTQRNREEKTPNPALDFFGSFESEQDGHNDGAIRDRKSEQDSATKETQKCQQQQSVIVSSLYPFPLDSSTWQKRCQSSALASLYAALEQCE